MNTMKAKGLKGREKEIIALYAEAFKNKEFPDTPEMRQYENMRMVNVYELLKEGKVTTKANDRE